MEQQELEIQWVKVQHFVKAKFNRQNLPDLNAILFLIGIQELGKLKPTFSKEEKQDLIHIAVCKLLSEEGYFEFSGKDKDGWPHWKMIRKPETGDETNR